MTTGPTKVLTVRKPRRLATKSARSRKAVDPIKHPIQQQDFRYFLRSNEMGFFDFVGDCCSSVIDSVENAASGIGSVASGTADIVGNVVSGAIDSVESAGGFISDHPLETALTLGATVATGGLSGAAQAFGAAALTAKEIGSIAVTTVAATLAASATQDIYQEFKESTCSSDNDHRDRN